MKNNKNLGVVFTPGNIAAYMSKILIYHYLIKYTTKYEEIKNLICHNKTIHDTELRNKISGKLKNIKILEPSIGEGSLLVEIVKLLINLNAVTNKNSNVKNDIINSLYGFEINKKSLDKARENILKSLNMKEAAFNFINDDFLLLNINNKINEKFDIIIGNPPYIKEKENKNLFLPFKNTEYYQGRMDIWYLFLQYSIDLLKNDGFITYIVPNNWTTNKSAGKLRDSIKHKTEIISIVDFNNYNVFDEAAIQTMILTLRKRKPNPADSAMVKYKKYSVLSDNNNDKLDNFLKLKNFENIKVSNNLNGLTFTSIKIRKLLKKIENAGNFKLQRRKEITQGIVHPQNAVSKSNESSEKGFIFNDGVFVISRLKKKELNLNRKEKYIVKPTYTTKELKQYFKFGYPRFWTIYTDKTFNKSSKIKKYPNIKEHLDRYMEIITSDNKPYGLHRPRKEYFFKKGGKILVARKCKIPTFTYIEDECYPTFTFNVIKSDRISLKYLTVLLNSRLIMFWLKHKGKLQGKHFQLDIAPLLEIPIRINNEKTKELEEKLNLLIKEKKMNKNLIREIDSIIYKIYGLDRQEIDIIEKDVKESHGEYITTET